MKELEILYVFERLLEDHSHGPTRDGNDPYLVRQRRRAEILAEIAKLEARSPWFTSLRMGGAGLLLCASVFVTIHYLLK
jgi:hypothetical protein